MTEEIIVDGVDVAGCVQLVEEPNYPCGLGGECKGWENCYYKQLKRLEQENKDFEILAKSLYKRIEELEKENEALAFREILYKVDYEASEQENEQLRSALEEIRANIQNWINSPWSCFNCRNNMDERLTEIKNRINEVLDVKY